MTQVVGQEIGGAAEKEFDPLVYLRILRRRVLLIAITGAVVFGVGYVVAYSLPSVYVATATILVESQQIPASLAQSTVTANADERIQVIKQRLMTRDNLLGVARKYSLYADDPSKSPSDIVDLLRKATEIQRLDVGNRGGSGAANSIGFTIAFENRDPSAAAGVANELVTSILEQNILARTARAAQTSKFFDQQVAQLEKELGDQEAKIIDFKNKNQASLPETLVSRQAILGQLQAQASEIRGRVTTLESQRDFLASQEGPVLDGGNKAPEAELAQLRNQLVQLRAVFSDTHPEVRAVAARIAAMEKALLAPAAPSPNAPKDQRPGSNGGPNATRIADINNQIEVLTKQLADIEKRSSALDQSIQRTPEIEVALNVLMRDYGTLQNQFKVAQDKALQATTGEQLEADRQAERFDVLERAVVPSQPAKPDRFRLVAAAGFVAGIASLGMAAIAELLDKSIRTSADLESQLGIRALAGIPYVETRTEQWRRRRRRLLVPTGGILVLVIAVVVVHYYIMPLDVLFTRIMSRLKF